MKFRWPMSHAARVAQQMAKASREQMGEDISPGFIARITEGVRYAISGVTPDTWMGPNQPLQPLEQEQTAGRRFDYPVGYNLQILPRSEEAISFYQLHALADGYDLLRIILETRKDQIASFEWEIIPYREDETKDQHKDDIRNVSDFLQRPDKENDWDEWLRMQVEDNLVIDAICICPRVSRGGELYGLEIVDGSSIKRLIDDGGRVPIPPSPAYQQVLKGIPTSDYTSEQLIYKVRNPRSSRVYGLSPVEQIITTVNIALRRQVSQMDAYTKGNVPEAIAQTPASWTTNNIQDFQNWWDGMMLGNIAAKRQIKFVPNLENIIFTKEGILKDEYDEWLARIICFAFSITPSALVKQVNRASGEQMADTAKEEGLLPLLGFFARHMTNLIRGPMGMPHLRFKWKIVNKIDPTAQANIHKTYIDTKVMTPDEVRVDLGKEILTPEQREAAFPAPPPAFGFGQQPGPEDGEKTNEPPTKKEPMPQVEEEKTKKEEVETETSKALSSAIALLASCVEKLDPRVHAEIMEKIIRAQPPTVVELKPEVNVDVGETTMHAHIARDDGARTIVTERRADGSLVAKMTKVEVQK